MDSGEGYRGDKVKHWLSRSASPEYQQAYDQIAMQVLIDANEKDQVVVENGCGVGEVLLRLAISMRYRLLVGTDVSPEMLDQAARNLQHSGIDANILNDASTLTGTERGVYLALDDLTNSHIPTDFADATLFLFSDITNEYHGEEYEHDMDIVMALAHAGIILPPQLLGPALPGFRTDFHQTRVTKVGGKIYNSIYGGAQGPVNFRRDPFIQMTVERFAAFGAGIDGYGFLENEGIVEDVTMDFSAASGKVTPGYHLVRLRKDRNI